MSFLCAAHNSRTVVYFFSLPPEIYVPPRYTLSRVPPLPGILQGTDERRERNRRDSLLIVYETSYLFLLEIACRIEVGEKRGRKNLGAIEVNIDFLELFPISKCPKITDGIPMYCKVTQCSFIERD